MKTKSPLEAMLDKIDYTAVDPPKEIDELPYVTHQGIFKIGKIELRVFVLNTGQRVIDKDDFEKFFALTGQDMGVK